MDGRGFDDLTRRFATKLPRRTVLKGLLGLGSAAGAGSATSGGGAAAWSTLVCLPDGSGGYIERLVPTVSVPFYVRRYGAVLPEGGACPCLPLSVEEACAGALCGEVRERGCGLSASCPGLCDGTGCFPRVSDGAYFCAGSLICMADTVSCSAGSPCQGLDEICDTVAGLCVTCLSDADCSSSDMVCLQVSPLSGFNCIGERACGLPPVLD